MRQSMNGVININKPQGMTSHDVVAKLRKILNIKKVGHTGTLDPDATGVLPICVGRATKAADMLTASDKQYLAEVTLGSRTDTMDASGTVLETAPVAVTKRQIEEAVQSFLGESEQLPPMYSAVKVGGRKLYELAREGKEVARAPRRIRISSIAVQSYAPALDRFTMLVDCTKGTYIRTLCDDIGKALGCFAHMSALQRTRSGRFSIEDSVTIEQVAAAAKEGDFSFLTPVDRIFTEYPQIYLAQEKAQRVCCGARVKVAGLQDGAAYRVYDETGRFLTISRQEQGSLKIIKTFYQE